jgi:aldose sugar dehydrogenase
MRVCKPFIILIVSVWMFNALAIAETSGSFKSSIGLLEVEYMAGPFDHPWAIAFLPKAGSYLVTERKGDLRLVEDGQISAPVEGVPDVWASGQGGLLDVALDPNYSHNQRIFLSYSEPIGLSEARTALATGILQLDGLKPQLNMVKVIFRQKPPSSGGRHFGSRIAFSKTGKLFLTLGDRGNRHLVQNLSNHFGKVIRINRDGSIPKDNPFVWQSGALPEIWSFGHRNPQGAAMRLSDDAFFTISHGAAGGDEINRSQPGKNFGWPEVSYGTHYTGQPFPVAQRSDVVSPLYYWDPSIAPSGAAFYDGNLFPAWKDNLFVGALRDRMIARVKITNGRASEEERLLENKFGRIRDVRVGPDGAIWFATDDSEGAIYRIISAGDAVWQQF